MSGHSEAEIQHHIRTYMMVFGALAVLTVVTVAISYLDLSVGAAVVLALIVASVKASLVALYFMHLVSEEKVIYWLLGLTACFFVFVMYIPTSWFVTEQTTTQVWSVLPEEGSAKHVGGHGHHDGHGDDGHDHGKGGDEGHAH